jgi:Flp pilus assembly pilin Flp
VNNFIARIYAMIAAVLFPPVPVLARVRSRRGAGMLEYALVALISIAVFGVLIEQFTGILSNLAKTIAEKLGVSDKAAG